MTNLIEREDDILLFCYETEIGYESSYEEMIRRITWNYGSRFDRKPQGASSSLCSMNGPLHHRELARPFWDSRVFSRGSSLAQRIFPAPRRLVFTRRLRHPLSQGRSSTSAGCRTPSSGDTTLKSGGCWLFSVVDKALLELQNVADEFDFQPDQLSTNAEKDFSSLKSPPMTRQKPLKARITEEQFSKYCGVKRGLTVTEELQIMRYDHLPWPWTSLPLSNNTELTMLLKNMSHRSAEEFNKEGMGGHTNRVDPENLSISYPPVKRSGVVTNEGKMRCSDYDHLPWPFISLPSSNVIVLEMLQWKEFQRSNDRSDAIEGSKNKIVEHNTSSPSSPPLSDYPLMLSNSSANRSPLVQKLGLRPRQLWPLKNVRKIPVLSPLGLHRTEGGYKILGGPGVNHMNLIQVRGNPAHGWQPRYVQRWRAPSYVQRVVTRYASNSLFGLYMGTYMQ